jgi:hypothetical protein
MCCNDHAVATYYEQSGGQSFPNSTRLNAHQTQIEMVNISEKERRHYHALSMHVHSRCGASPWHLGLIVLVFLSSLAGLLLQVPYSRHLHFWEFETSKRRRLAW